MKLDTLRKVIREEVKAAIKEELQDMLNEAVKIASQPSTSNVQKSNQYKPVVQKDLKQTWSTGKINTGTVPLEEMLNQTADEKHISKLAGDIKHDHTFLSKHMKHNK